LTFDNEPPGKDNPSDPPIWGAEGRRCRAFGRSVDTIIPLVHPDFLVTCA
jgi:hypothetical protein